MAQTDNTPKSKNKPSAFEAPRLDAPNFDMPKVEMPAAFREFAEKGAAQAKEAYERLRSAAEESTAVLEDTYATAAAGVTAYNLKLIECARFNTNAAFDFFGEFITVKSLSEAVEVSSSHARKQFEAVTAQSKELTALVQKVATQTAEPIKSGVNSAFNKAA